MFDKFHRKEHILFHQSNKNENIKLNIANNDSDINNNQDKNDIIDLSTIILGFNNNKRNRRRSMNNYTIRRYSVN